MTLNLPLLYFVWTDEYCQTSPKKPKSSNIWHVTSILVCCIFGADAGHCDFLTSSHPQMSASHLLGLQGPQQTPDLIFAILYFEISSLMSLTFFPWLNSIYLPAVACKIQVWNRLKSMVTKLEYVKNQVQLDRKNFLF
jgi:hypothetical protein